MSNQSCQKDDPKGKRLNFLLVVLILLFSPVLFSEENSQAFTKIAFPRGEQVEGEFTIDTGAPINLLINSPAAEENGLYTILEKKREREFKTLADVQTVSTAMAESVKIGKFECEVMEIYISTSKKGLFAGTKYAGIVGNKFFQNFYVIFDYKRKRLHIEKY